MKNELSKMLIGIGATCTVSLPGVFNTGIIGCTGVCGSCSGGCVGEIVSSLGVLSLYCYRKVKCKISVSSKKNGEGLE
ncbi:MAG: hypothetical protein PHH31_09160 [Acidaminococcaceae bacterium]|nr:hypothetical protein [Acidaminococcaceae bacterium]MDD4722937.1 hypothetical protein [Acidaminococcaceae bacterium]